MRHSPTRFSFIGGAFALLLLAAGCASNQQTQSEADMLIASGFQSRTPDSAQQRKLQAIPAGQLSEIDAYGKVFYVYPDWPGNRVLIGGTVQYQAYQQLRTSRNLPAETPAKVVHGPSFDWRQWYSGA